MKLHRLSIAFIFLFLSLQAFTQTTTANTLLWRITGNALTRPSYLFGTMHVNNKKAFHFQDSLYRFLEGVDAFAMEIHPDSTSMLMTAYLNGELPSLETEKRWSKSDNEQLEKQLKKEGMKLPGGSRGRKLQYLLGKMMNSQPKENEAMDTFMDAYLYEVARRNTKEIFGLEQVQDQLAALSVLQKGLQVKNFVKLLDKWNPDAESPIHQLYYKEDIGEMEAFYKSMFTDSVLNIFLYNRNAVMVQKMDSLMHRKTLFTAVGAGHLAGAQGVITLLQSKGYKVEPVFSNQRIMAGDYKLKAPSLNWPVVQQAHHGFTYSMPGTPTIQTGAQGSEIALYYDMGNGLSYMTVSGRLSAKEKSESTALTTKEHLAGYMQSTGAVMVNSNTLATDSINGFEALCKAKDNSYFRYREWTKNNMFYVFTLAANNKDALYTPSAEHYFTSFKVAFQSKRIWQTTAYTPDGFAVALPVTPKVEPLKVEAAAVDKLEWKAYRAFDHHTALNYTVTINKALAGSELQEDWFFDHYIENVEANVGGKEVHVRDTVFNGFPAKTFISEPFNDNVVKGLILKRNNFCYFLAAEYNNSAAEADADRFLASFALAPFAKSIWRTAAAPDNNFTMWAPGPVAVVEETEADVPANSTNYYAYDAATADNYIVRKTKLSKYLWASHVDSVYSYWVQQNVDAWSDTVISNVVTTNSGLPARALVVKNKKNGLVTKLRYLLNGDEMYEVAIRVPPVFMDETNSDSLLRSFTIAAPKKPDLVLSNHPDLLFMDLQLQDSMLFTHAYNALDHLPFSVKELPLLMHQVLQAFPETEYLYNSVNVKLLNKVQAILKTVPGGNDTLLHFITQHYHTLDTVVQHLQYTMLRQLAEDNRSAAQTVLKNLLLQSKPAAGSHYALFYTLRQQPATAALLYPGLLQYMPDETIGASVMQLTNQLLDSGMIHIDVVKNEKGALLQLLQQHLKGALKNPDVEEIIFPAIELAGRLNQPEVNSLMARYVNAKSIDVKYEAALALLQQGQPVPAAALNALAAHRYYRSKLYQQLKAKNKSALFPAAYKSQKLIGESYIYAALADEEGLDSEPAFIFIKSIEQIYKGEKKRFFLYRLNLDASEEAGSNNEASYLSVAGPFDVNAATLDIADKDNISGTYYNSNFDGNRLDILFKKYLQEVSKSRTE